MHVPTSGQTSLFAADLWLSDEKRARLDQSWAGPFRRDILPILVEMEPQFARFYSPDQGAPNKPVATMLGLLILKETFDLTDAEVVERFEYDLQWHHALNTPTTGAHVCEKTLYNFRQNLLSETTLKNLFAAMVDRMIEKWNLKTSRHRIDSTQILSNMKVLSRLGLFVKTIEQFLARLKKKDETRLAALPKRLRERYLERRGYFADAKSSEARRRLERSARDLWYLIDRFRGDKDIAGLKAYKTMVRLFDEQCERVQTNDDDQQGCAVHVTEPAEPAVAETAPTESVEEPTACDDDDAADTEPVAPVLKKPGDIASDSLQSPSDTDATFSGHKGKGYQAQIVETCHEDNPFQVIDHVTVEGAHESDQNAPAHIHQDLRDRGHEPRESFADAGYISGKNIVEADDEGIDLIGPMSGKEPSGKKISLAQFAFTRDRRRVKRCPAGHAPVRQEAAQTEGVVNAHFDRAVCDTCSLAAACPTCPTRKTRRLRFSREDVAIAQRRQRQETDAFKEAYKIRSGAEATIGHLKNDRGMGCLRVRGSPAVRLTVTLKVLAENCFRAVQHVLNTAHANGETLPAAAA